jgi:hypothetical protein
MPSALRIIITEDISSLGDEQTNNKRNRPGLLAASITEVPWSRRQPAFLVVAIERGGRAW